VESLLYEVDDDMDKFYYGKRDERKLLYLSEMACMTQKPVNTFLTGESAIGKSEMIKAVGRYIPASRYYSFTRISPTALNRYKTDEPSWTWNGKILAITELKGAEQASDVLRVLMSEGESRALITEKTSRGKMEAVLWEIEGKPTIVTSTADSTIEHQFATRCFAIEVDFTTAELRKILIYIAENETVGKEAKPNPNLIKRINKLKPYSVEIPYAVQIGKLWVAQLPRATRDLKNFFSLIRAHALVNQGKRSRSKSGALIATEDDYEVCRSFIPILYKNSFFGGLTHKDAQCLRAVKRLSEEKSYSKITPDGKQIEIKGGTIEDVMDIVAMSSGTASERLSSLVDLGVLVQYKRYEGNQRRPYVYSPAFELDAGTLPKYDKLMEVE